MHSENAFFAETKLEPLIWAEDPGDHPLMDTIPSVLAKRSSHNTDVTVFSTTRPKQVHAGRHVRISVIRNGKRRASVAMRA